MALLNADLINPLVEAIPEVNDLLAAEEKELGLLPGQLDTVVQEAAYSATSAHIARMEAIFGITANPSLSLEERRDAILVYVNTISPMTPARMKQIVDTITGSESKVEEDFANYAFQILFEANPTKLTDIELIKQKVELMKPAHLNYSVNITQSMKAELYPAIALVIGDTITIRQVI